MAKCVYDGKGYLPECEHCIDTVGTGVVCTHDCVIELREEIEKRDALIKELADALDRRVCRIKDCRTECGAGMDACIDIDHRELVDKAREVVK